MKQVNTPSITDLENARKIFEENEPRDLFYRAAIELTELAINNKTSISLSEALAVLLQTWNRAYYQFRRFDSKHFNDIENLISRNQNLLLLLRKQSLDSFNENIKDSINNLFSDFENVLGPVGAAKCLHLLAPDFLPLWDRAIADSYGLPLKKRGYNSELYIRFIEIAKEQCEQIGGRQDLKRNPLKAIDEYNYCKFTKKWI